MYLISWKSETFFFTFFIPYIFLKKRPDPKCINADQSNRKKKSHESLNFFWRKGKQKYWFKNKYIRGKKNKKTGLQQQIFSYWATDRESFHVVQVKVRVWTGVGGAEECDGICGKRVWWSRDTELYACCGSPLERKTIISNILSSQQLEVRSKQDTVLQP